MDTSTSAVGALGYRPFDADNHYYEAHDAFTRHLDPDVAPRLFRWVEVDGRRYHMIDGRLCTTVSNPTFDPIALPGALYDFQRGNPKGITIKEALSHREPLRPEYQDRDSRLSVMDTQGLEAVWLFPSLGVMYEEWLKHDTEANIMVFRAFNRWLEEEWGFAYQNRIFAAPYITLCDVDFACQELEWALQMGARVVCMRPASVTSYGRHLSPAATEFDPYWARVNEAGITVVVHVSDSGYGTNGFADDGPRRVFNDHPMRDMIQGRPTLDFFASILCEKLLERFPRLRLASVENGSDWLPELHHKITKIAQKHPGYFVDDPFDQLREHLWVAPFWEDKISDVVEIMGADRVLFGSDWPHVEGLRRPLDFLDQLEGITPADQRKILSDNVRHLNQLASSAALAY